MDVPVMKSLNKNKKSNANATRATQPQILIAVFVLIDIASVIFVVVKEVM